MSEWWQTGLLVAQTDPLSGTLGAASGWVGAGLLGAVLSWLLLKHLPAKDAQLERIITRHEEELSHAIADQRAEFTKALELLLRHNADQNNALSSAINKDLELIRHLVKDAIDKLSQRPHGRDGER